MMTRWRWHFCTPELVPEVIDMTNLMMRKIWHFFYLSHACVRSSISPEDVPITKKSRRQSSSSPDMQDSKSSISRSNSFTKQESNGRNQHHPVSTYDEDNSKYADRRLSKGSVEQSDVRVKKHRKKSRSSSPEMSHIKKSATASKAKEHIPRYRLHKIFSLISQDSDFVLDEDISIAIQRNPYAEPSEDSTVTVVLDVELFSMIYPNKGRKHTPIFDREDIKKFGHDKNLADDPDFERRVIRVKPGKSSSGQTDPGPSTSSYQQSSSLMITRTVNRNRSQSSSRSRSRSAPRTTKPRDPQIKLRVSTDARFETRYAEIQKRGDSGSSRRSNLEPNDLRHELSTSRRLSSEGRTPVDREKGHFDDRRQSDDRCQSDDRRHSNDRRQSESHREHKQELKKDREELPDFSRRKDKYQYTPWLDQPELIPKDPKYFMHDDRESMDFRNRDRGRGRFFRGRTNFRRPFRPFRSRGNFRGPYRGRGFGPSNPQPRSPRRNSFSDNSYSGYKKSEEREWKHDKFSELERGDGEKKSRQQDSQHQHSTSDR